MPTFPTPITAAPLVLDLVEEHCRSLLDELNRTTS
jgi:hypothetical protein